MVVTLEDESPRAGGTSYRRLPEPVRAQERHGNIVTAIVKQERLRVTPQRLARITGWLTLALARL